MRIAIREQLALLVLFAVLLALAVVSVPTWIFVHNHIADNLRRGLALTASLKASRIANDLNFLRSSCISISSRIILQKALANFLQTGNASWADAIEDLSTALSVNSDSGLLQVRLYPRNATENGGRPLINVTASNVPEVTLPYNNKDGSPILLGQEGAGYPAVLYPNITYKDLGHPNRVRPNLEAIGAEAFPGVLVSDGSGVLLGPLIINGTSALLSVSLPVRDNNDTFILGYMTVVVLASALIEVRDSREGLGKDGTVLIVGSSNLWNRFNVSTPPSNATYTADQDAFDNTRVRFILPPGIVDGTEDRHSQRAYDNTLDEETFISRQYPAVVDSFVNEIDTPNNASADLNTRNEQDFQVAVGYARAVTPLADWAILVEQSHQEAWRPIATLRDILLGTVFGTAGLIIVLVVPCAHLSVMPIRKLKAATENSVNPPGYEDATSTSDFEDGLAVGAPSEKSTRGVIPMLSRLVRGQTNFTDGPHDVARRRFKIPAKVEDRKHFITDELTELTRTFNDMSEELVKQYTSLDEKVAERTKELEQSKKAAEAANESKTLFIANISHELKTPLNGILGMCSVCMEEDDLTRIRHSLKTVYKSGDLLLHLLEDLLSFSKNQIGQQLSLEMKEFRLADIRSQILSIFDKQVKEGRIDFSVSFLGPEENHDSSIGTEKLLEPTDSMLPALGPQGTGRLKDMCVWGDQHRILQVIINLVSNSLKFTPPGGKVEVQIRCLGEGESAGGDDDKSWTSSISRNTRTGRARHRGRSGSVNSGSTNGRNNYKGGTALAINPMDPKATPHIRIRERSPTPPPPGARTLLFEFVVSDTGPGIPEHMLQKVFEPFVQGDLGLSKKFGGTGLGLSICHQLATLMGGSIDLDSSVGSGTTFSMHIPLKFVQARYDGDSFSFRSDAPSLTAHRASSTASSSIPSRPPSMDATDLESQGNYVAVKSPTVVDSSGSKAGPGVQIPQPRLIGLSQPFFTTQSAVPKSTDEKMAEINRVRAQKEGTGKLHVLVADDNSTNIEVVSRMLKLEDIYDVTIAKDGQEAYDLVKATMQRNEAFDVIFMDVQMPNLDGLQSTRLIREMGYRSPIVALTAFSEESNVRECIDSGMDEFLAKPIRRPQLKQVLKKFATILEEESETTPPPPLVNGNVQPAVTVVSTSVPAAAANG